MNDRFAVERLASAPVPVPQDPGPLNWRPEIALTIPPDAPRDVLGRQAPRRLGVMGFLRAMPWLWRGFSQIPSLAWSVDVNAEGYSEAVIACPCGHQPRVEVGSLVTCDEEYEAAVRATEDEVDASAFRCPRSYLFLGPAVYVANSPHRSIERT